MSLELIEDEAGRPVGATLTAPEPFSLSSPPLPAEAAAALIGLEASERFLALNIKVSMS